MSSALDEMIEALRLEVVAIREQGDDVNVELRDGECIGQAEGSWLYRFVVADDLNLRDDTPVRVTVGQDDISGEIVSYSDGVLIVALEQNLGALLPVARLMVNEAFLIERLTECLEQVRSGAAQFSQSAAERAIGLRPPRVSDTDPNPAVTADGRLNDEQVSALRRSLGSDTVFVWGPPGTGKTETLARIVEAHYRAGRSVLLVSNTNIAVDTALERVADRLKGEPDFHQGLVIRQGPVVKKELRERFGPQVILKEIVARLAAPLLSEKEALSRDLASLQNEERSLSAALRDLRRLAEAQKALDDRERALSQTQAAIELRNREATQHRDRAATLAAEIARARAMGALRRLFSGINPERLDGERASAEWQAQAALDAARALASDLPKLEAEFQALRHEVAIQAGKTTRYPPEPEIQARLGTVGELLGQIRERISTVDNELATLEAGVLSRCRIIATTVYRTYLGTAPARRFDAIVIDEASMLMPPLVYYAAGLATMSVTIAGDFRQLPPIVASDEALAAKWLKRDVFDIAGIPERLKGRLPTPQLVALRRQYRMREPICAVINRLFYYDHPLHTDPSTNRGVGRLPLGQKPLLYVDTSPFHPWSSFRAGTYSRYNIFHALLVRTIVLHLVRAGFLPSGDDLSNAIGVVAPYAAQARLIQALLKDRFAQRAKSIAFTVHRFQGNEKRVMLLDLTDSFGTRLGRFLKATQIEEDGARLLNVAASRARHYLVLLANFEYLRAKAPRECVVSRLIAHFQEHGEAIEVGSRLLVAASDWIDGLHHVLPTGFELPDSAGGVFSTVTFYPAFAYDLAQAHKSILILSPVATGTGTARWINALRAAVARGVHVRVLTRPAETFGGGSAREVTELVRVLRQMGVVVDLRARMYEKLAVLDGRLLWHGSLDILSHRDTSQVMFRLNSPAACQQLGSFLSPLPGQRKAQTPDFDVVGNPACPICGGPTIWNNGQYGIWFECENAECDGKVNLRRGSHRAAGRTSGQRSRVRTSTGRPCPAPGCSGTLHERKGRFGSFLGCSNYPTCRYTENLNAKRSWKGG
jgi:ssDNA-binding Zn-finger/Zn-ribbon topoisomerase 1/tetratricopeptide (TPR) repeat protein